MRVVRRRKILLTAGSLAAAAILIVVAIPLWFPWVLRPMAARFGAKYESYRRVGYGGFDLHGFIYTNETVRFTAEHVNAPVPSLWLWRLLTQADSREQGAGSRELTARGIEQKGQGAGSRDLMAGSREQGDNRGRRTENGGRRTEDGGQRTEDGGQGSVVRGPWSVVHRMQEGESNGVSFLKIIDWNFEIASRSTPRTNSVSEEVLKWQPDLRLLKRWVPLVVLTNGSVHMQGVMVSLPEATWARGEFHANVSVPKFRQQAVVSAELASFPYVLRVNSATLHLESVTWLSTNGPGLEIRSTNSWWANPIELQARFGATGDLPESASLSARNFKVPVELTRLPEYQDIRGSLAANWEQGRFTANLTAGARARGTNLPPIDLELHARGDTNSAIIEMAAITSPWLRMELSRNLEVHFSGELLREPARLTLVAELARQHWVQLEGTVRGDVELRPAADKWPIARFKLSGANVGNGRRGTEDGGRKAEDGGPRSEDGGLQAKSLEMHGELEWPRLDIPEAQATFADDSKAAMVARLDLERKVVEKGRFNFEGGLPKRWLPEGYGFEQLTLSGEIQGAFNNLEHHGQLSVTNITSPSLNPVSLTAQWEGRQTNFTHCSLSRADFRVVGGGASLKTEAALEADTNHVELALRTLTFQKDRATMLGLTEPCQVELRWLQGAGGRGQRTGGREQGTESGERGAGGKEQGVGSGGQGTGRTEDGGQRTEDGGRWLGRVEALRWSGPGGNLGARGEIEWPRTGSINIELRGIQSELASGLVKKPLPPFKLNGLAITADWTNEPVRFGFEMSADYNGKIPVSAEVRVAGSKTGVSLQRLDLTSQSTALLIAQGYFPLALDPAGTNGLVNLHLDEPLLATASLPPSGGFWDQLASQAAVRVSDPQMNLEVKGTLRNPEGRLRLEARRVEVVEASTQVPKSLNTQIPKDRSRVHSAESGGARPPRAQQPAPSPVEAVSPGVAERESVSERHGVVGEGANHSARGGRAPPSSESPQPGTQLPKDQNTQGADELNIQEPEHLNFPVLENALLDVQFDKHEARVAGFRLLVQGQPVSFTGRLPMGDTFWMDLVKRKKPNWEAASARLQIDHAQIAAFAGLYPNYLSPQGEVEADLSVSPGVKLDGRLMVRGARTRPLPGMGPVREISADVRFQEHKLQLTSASANLGGSTVRASGRADLTGPIGLGSNLPPFSLIIRGTNVSLVRQPDAIIRGDLDLAVAKTNGAPPLVSGTVHLHDGFFLSDLRTLMAGKLAVPSKRPPYFSVDSPVLADWRLNVHAEGNRFLKVRTTVFKGEVSANINLEGSLETPLAVGEVTIDEGLASFPFGSLEVQHGFVTLTRENPFQPRLSVAATSKQFGYDIKMQVSGTTDAPVIEFTSVPPLSSEQILLLLTTGSLPERSFTLTPRQRAQTLAMYLARDVLSKLGMGESAEQRLTIQSGEEIAETGKPTYSVEFKLSKNVSLVGEYDRFGDFNAGMKWRVYSK